MSVNWLWKDKMGSIQWKNREGQAFTVSVYKGNCLCVMIYEYTHEDKPLYDFFGFFNDDSHLKKCIGLMKDYDGAKKNIYENEWISWKLNTFYKDSLTLAIWLTTAGYPVELYYEDIK